MMSGDLELSTKIYVYYLCMICPNHNVFQLRSDDMFMHLRVRIREHNIRAFPGASACSQIASCLPAPTIFVSENIDFGGFILIVDRALRVPCVFNL